MIPMNKSLFKSKTLAVQTLTAVAALDSVLRIRCHESDEKAKWNLAAQKAGMKLSDWARQQLNRAVRD